MNEIYIGVAADGFAIEYDGQRYWINQEDDPAEKLTELFEKMGFTVTCGEEY